MTTVRLMLLPWLILASALGVTWLVWEHERQSSQQALRVQFDFALRESVSRVEQRMAAYEQMLRGVQGLFAATGTMDRDTLDRSAFRDYVAALQFDANFTGIQAIGVSQWVTAAHRAAHLAAMRQRGFADYALQPAGERENYAPIVQREPYTGLNRAPPGFDPWSEPIRRLAMEKARDSGMVAISGKVRLSVDVDPQAPAQPGFIMYLPIYTRGPAPNDVGERRSRLVGWVFAAFRMNDLMASLYGEQAPGLALAIFDDVAPSADALLYSSSALTDATGPAEPGHLSADEYLVIGGHSWTLSARALSDFEARFGRNSAPLIAFAGTGLSLLLALLAWLLVTGRTRAMRLAVRMTSELRESEQRWAFALEGAGDGVWDWNLRTGKALNSPRWQEIVGCGEASAETTLASWEERIHPDDHERAMNSLQDCLDAPSGTNAACVAEYRVRCDQGQWKWILSRGMVVERDEAGRPLRIIGTLSDISARKASEEQIQRMAQHDALTDLPNRALFSDRLQRELTRARRQGARFALFFLDLDRFKPINDRFGHAVGDQVLRRVASRLLDTVRESDTVGRIGGDEFVILVSGLAEADDALGLAEKILKALHSPLTVEGRELAISCSLGIAIYPEDGTDEITLTKNADDAMYRAKSAGGDQLRVNGTP
jgi:diguanylate cyclase (GGDEF)-like protein/PAS domain S-box-containing protein